MSDPPVVVRVVRRFNLLANKVFDAWTVPELLGQWMFGPNVRDEEVVRLSADARVGGAFSFVVRRQGAEIDHVGTYREVNRPRRLVFTWGVVGPSKDESVVTIDILPADSGCELTLAHEMAPQWAEFASRTEAGWTKMLETLNARIT